MENRPLVGRRLAPILFGLIGLATTACSDSATYLGVEQASTPSEPAPAADSSAQAPANPAVLVSVFVRTP